MSHIAYIGIGSNLGNRLANCQGAVDSLGRHAEIRVRNVSRWYETQALAGETPSNDPPYVNGVVEITTSLAPYDLLNALIAIESSLRRPHPRPKGVPRTIDLDILLYDRKIIDSPDLCIPHPGLPKRLFVLVPLCDIAPAFVHPVTFRSIKEMMEECRRGPKQSCQLLAQRKEGLK